MAALENEETMAQWSTVVSGRRLFLGLSTALVVQQIVVGITEPELLSAVVVAMAGVLGYGADRRRESSATRPDDGGPSPAPSSRPPS